MMKPTLLILAAGMGSRYGGLKQLDSFGPNGETLMEYAVFDAIRAGFGKVVFVIRKEFADSFNERFNEKFSSQIEVVNVLQEIPESRVKPWGTGHAILCARDVIHEPFAVINSDDYYGIDGFKQMSDFLQTQVSGDRLCMIGYILQNTLSDSGVVNRGICNTHEESSGRSVLDGVKECFKIKRQEDGKIKDEQGNEFAGDTVVSMNFWGFDPIIFKYLERDFEKFVAAQPDGSSAEFLIPTIVDQLIQNGSVVCDMLVSNDIRCGVTYPEDKEIVQGVMKKRIENGDYPEKLW